jgi:hypothetical protein
MRPLFLLSFFSLLLMAYSCGSGTKPAEQETESEELTVEQNVSIPMEGENYTIRVVDDQPASPRKEMTTTLGGVQVTVDYGSPSVKGREIWGGLEPYDRVWRAGANGATAVTFSDDVLVEGQPLAAGTYALFVIPRQGDWTVVFNSVAEQWGAYDHDPAKDVLRADISPRMEEANQESLEYYSEGNDLVLRWEKIALPVTITPASAEQ